MFMSVKDLEQQLRQGADGARRTPSKSLRTRTMNALLHEARQAPDERRARRFGRAILAGAFMMALIAIGAVVLHQASPSNQGVSDIGPQSIARHTPINLPELPLITSANVESAISAPLRREVQLMARDAERVFDRLRAHVNRLPRLDGFERRAPVAEGATSGA